MRAPGRQRGVVLLWAVLILLAVTGAVAVVSAGLSRQARAVRHLQAMEREADLVRSARLLARHRIRQDPDWKGPEVFRLSGGEAEMTLVAGDGGPDLVVVLDVRGRTGTVTRRISLGGSR